MFSCRGLHAWALLRSKHAPRSRRQMLRAGAVLMAATLLSGCAWFSPDAGIGVVAGIADQELQKDVLAIRTPEQAELARDAVRRLLKRNLTADAAVQAA